MDILTTPDVSDQVLIAQCINGDPRAWAQLLGRYKRLIYAVTLRFAFRLEDRHDIFQSVCLETLKSLPSLRNASSLRYWLLTITVRQCYALNKCRRDELGLNPDDSTVTIHDPRSDTMQIFLATERAEMLRGAMMDLPERCRVIIDLLFFSDNKVSYSELGGLFGQSKESIGSVRLRCLERLRKILESRNF